AVADDLNLPSALAILQRCAVDPATGDRTRLAVALTADTVLGLDLASVASEHVHAPREVLASVEQHRAARAADDYARADLLRASFDGYRVEGVSGGGAVVSRGDRRVAARERRTISSAEELSERRADPASLSWSSAVVTAECGAEFAWRRASVLRLPLAD